MARIAGAVVCLSATAAPTLDTCMELSITDPFGSPFERHLTSGGTDQLAARVTAEAAKMTAVLAALRS